MTQPPGLTFPFASEMGGPESFISLYNSEVRRISEPELTLSRWMILGRSNFFQLQFTSYVNKMRMDTAYKMPSKSVSLYPF